MSANKIIASLLVLFLISGSSVSQARAHNLSKSTPQTNRGIENGPALIAFNQSLAALKNGRRKESVRIVQYGDSHTAADLMTGTIRKSFQRDFQNPPANKTPAVIFDVFGINGARAVKLTSWSDRVFAANFSRRQPDLIILAYGTNEVTDGNWSIESYQRMFASILRRLRRLAPNASLLVIAPPDRAQRVKGRWQSVGQMPQLIEAQRRAAYETGAAFWSSYAAMGGAGSMSRWVEQGLGQADHVHLTAAGYARLGEMFYRDFTAAHAAHLAKPLPTQTGLLSEFFELTDAPKPLQVAL